jgi:hypothetical protein
MTKIVGDVHALMRFSFDSRVGSALAGKAGKGRRKVSGVRCQVSEMIGLKSEY